MLELNNNVPSLIKYMGSKTEIINFVVAGLNEIHKDNQPVCDLFGGSATLAGTLRNNNIEFISNDIQIYSSVLANTYLNSYDWDNYPSSDDLILQAEAIEREWKDTFLDYWNEVDYSREFTLDTFTNLEEFQRAFLDNDEFMNRVMNAGNTVRRYHLFSKDYSGTYWSFRQCVWIDIMRAVADRYRNNDALYNLILSSTMFAMAYNSQSTGHYAQYRKAETEKSMDDILIYRRKNLKDYFKRKYDELRSSLLNQHSNFKTYALNYTECLDKLNKGTLVYADPPYCSVHYSRFYHAIETFVRYDYPTIKYDGRYRDDRHQSPFCIATKVRDAFKLLFEKLQAKECELVLSYSDSATSMIDLETLLFDAITIFNNFHMNEIECKAIIKQFILENGRDEILDKDTVETNINVNEILRDYLKVSNYEVSLKMFEHIHSTMGRREDKDREVLETLILVKKIN